MFLINEQILNHCEKRVQYVNVVCELGLINIRPREEDEEKTVVRN